MKIPLEFLASLLLTMAVAGCAGAGADVQAAMEASAEVEYSLPTEVSPPQAGTARASALHALDRATGFVLYSLQPWFPPEPSQPMPAYGSPERKVYDAVQNEAWEKSQREWCTTDRCLHHNKVLGKVPVQDTRQLQAVTIALRESLGQVPSYASACIPEYRHAIGFAADGKNYLVMLCYGCGQVAVAIDGVLGESDQTHVMGDESALDAILGKAGIPLAPKPRS